MVALALLALSAPSPGQFAAWGTDALQILQRESYRPETKLFFEGGAPVTLATEAQIITAYAAAAGANAKLTPQLRTAVATANQYVTAGLGAQGFYESPQRTGVRSFEHNAELALALQFASRVDKSSEAAGLASTALAFALSGDDKSGGVRTTDEPGSKPSLSATATTALAVLGQSELGTLKHAQSEYDWIRTTLRDPATNLFFATSSDHEPGPDPSGAALMIQLAAALYDATKEERYAEQSRRLEVLSIDRWDTLKGVLTCETSSGARLTQAWFDRIRRCPRPLEAYGAVVEATSALQFLHDKGRDRSGHFGRQFAMPPATNGAWSVSDTAAASWAFSYAAVETRTKR